jgi:Ca-activated chloride channel family protein
MRSAVVGLIGLIVTAGATVTDQQVSARGQRPTFRSTVELVVVRVTVVDRDKRPIGGLTKEDFIVLENGARQQVSHFLSSEVPLDVALLLDTSSSMKPLLSQLRASAVKFLGRLEPADRGMVVGFNDRTHILASLTGDASELRRGVNRLRTRGDTRLYDGLYITLGTLSAASRDLTRRQALVVLSDGRDTTSHLGIEDVRRQAIMCGVPIYPILLSDEQVAPARDFEKTFGLFDITELARETGGQAFRIDEATDLEQAYSSIAQELSEQYVLAYPATEGPDGDRGARIVVQVPSQPDAVARAHVGYVNRHSFGG